MPRRLIRSTKSKIAESVGPLTEVRRHGWLHDYHMELDQGPDRSITSAGPDPYQHDRLMQRAADRGECVPPAMPSNQAPVVVNVNINLGDLLSRIASGRSSAAECLEEMIGAAHKELLTEASDPQEFKKGDRVRHAVGDVRVGAARVLSHGEGEVVSTPNAWDRTVRVLWDRAGGKIQSVPYGEIEKVTR